MKKIIRTLILAVACTLLVACAKTNKNNKINIVTSIYPIYDWTLNVVGNNDNINITLLQDSGADLHNYQPTVADIAKVSSSDLFIYVGGESDEWVEDALKSAVNKDMITINLLETLGDKAKEEELIEGMEGEEEGEDHDHEEGEEEEVEYDEHVWLSLKNAQIFVSKIKDAIASIDKANAKTYEANAKKYNDELKALDNKYADAYFDQIADWVSKNPYSFGANYKCGQECALRMISCLLTYPCFQSRAKEADINNIKSIISGSYRKILSNFFYAHRCIRNNHTISELVGMIIGSWCCKDDNRMKYAYRTLDAVIHEQFLDDGGYTQQSFNYQRLALMDLEIVLAIGNKTGMNISNDSKDRVLQCALQLFQCQDQSGDVPNYGSNDGALILPLTIFGYRDFRPGINAIYYMIRECPLYNEPFLQEELLWLGVLRNNDHAFKESINRVSVDYPKTGLSVFRSDRHWMMVVCKREMHHMDNGHIDLWIDGKNILCDAGSYSYASDLGRELYSNVSHNTAYCKGLTQIRRIGAFAVYGQPVIKKREWHEDSIEFEVEYSTGYSHRRNVKAGNNRYDIFDEVINSGRECYIQFHIIGEVKKLENNCVETESCLLRFNVPVSITNTKRSLYYLKSDDTTCISVPCNKAVHTIIEIKENTEND